MTTSQPRFETLMVALEGDVEVITLNRPDAMNTINYLMAQELREALRSARKDGRVRAVLLRASGRAFCAGFELGSSQAEPGEIPFQARQGLAEINEICTAIISMEKPVIAAVNGIAVGGGFSLVLCCDLAVASESARFSVIYARRGLMSDLGINYLLPKYVGLRKAKEMIFTADFVDAKEAERLGLVNKTVPAIDLDREAMALAKRMAAGPTRALGLSKIAVHRAMDMDLSASLDWETMGQALCIQTEDVREGWTAFFEKREPKFKGK
ncbi:MAG: hypothetical protein FJZ95_01825 [Chloroflexi bacterium]|nr:hypothetical protein [Chloroflexota bacterium]